MGLEQSQLVLLIQGHLLQIQPGGVNVSCTDPHTLGNVLCSDDRSQHCLVPVVPVDLVPCLQLHAGMILGKAVLFQQSNGISICLTLRLGSVQKRLVLFRELIALFQLAFAHALAAMLLLIKKCLFQFLCGILAALFLLVL